jgi:hypothetical protein
VGHASSSIDLLHVETSRVRIFQSGLMTGGGMTASGVYGMIMEIVSS